MNQIQDEQNFGVRQIYSMIPSSQELLEQMNVPLAIHLSPLCQNENIVLSENPPFKCECGTFLNSLNSVNYNNNSFDCNMCSKQQKLPRYLTEILEQEEMPLELQYQAIEYRLSQQHTKQTIVFVIDTCVSEENFESLKKALLQTAEQFDFTRNNFVFITFNRSIFFYKKTQNGKMVHVVQVPSYMNNKSMAQTLQISNLQGNTMNSDLIQQKFFMDNLEDVVNVIEAMDKDYWHTPNDQRPQRATGKALEMTLNLLTLAKCSSSRIALFLSGPCTISQGQIASLQISEFIRKQVDLEENKEISDRVKKSKLFYDNLAKNFQSIKTCLDIFAYSLNQYGLYEMQNLVRKTNGLIFLGEEFKEEHFKLNLQRYFSKDQNENSKLFSAVSMHVKCSSQLLINGVVGNCQKVDKKIKNSGSNKIGECDTNEWYLGGGDPLSTFLFFFDIEAKNKTKAFRTGQNCTVQFVVKYLHSEGIYRMRVITVQRQFLHATTASQFLDKIDQFTLISTYGKLAAYRSLKQDSFFVRRYLDQKLIHIMRSFKQGQEIPQNLNLLPQYFYYLRKSLFVSKSSVSLDEITYYRQAMLQQNVDNVLVMIQPQIIEYSLQNEDPVPVMPDMDCMKNEVVLLADLYFNIIIWRGNTIKTWIDQEYHLQEGYEYLQNLVNLPEEDCQLIIEDRLIHPFKMYAYPGSPTERYLKSRLNPENKNMNQEHEAVQSGNFITDDASLSEFMKKLLQVINRKEN